MARQPNDGLKLFANLEGVSPNDERPDLVVSAQDGKRQMIFEAKFGEDGNASIPKEVLKKAERFSIGPPSEGDEVRRPSDSALKFRREQFQAVLERGQIDISRSIWIGWLRLLRCVSGRVRVCRRSPWWFNDLVALATQPVLADRTPSIKSRALQASCAPTADTSRNLLAAPEIAAKRLSPAGSIDQLIAWPFRCFPVCRGRVEVWRRVCCCEPWIVFDPRIPELVKELEDIVQRIPRGPIPPIPDPGPLMAAAPLVDPSGDNVMFREGALDERAVRAAEDLRAIKALSDEQIPAYINARPYLFCRRYDCGQPVKVAEGDLGPDGVFNICWFNFPYVLRPGCHEEFAYIVRQPFGQFWLTIYNGVAAGHWYDDDDNPTLTSYSPFAYGCRGNPSGNFVFLDLIGDTGAHELITPNADSAISVDTPVYNSGLVFPAPNPAAADGAALNRNWGGTLKLSFMFSEGMQDVGAKYYRVSIIEADGSGDPTGTRHYYDTGLSWNKAVPDGGGGVDIVPVSLGPTSAGSGGNTQNFLYEIPYDTNPTTDWNAGQYHAHINTDDLRWNDPDVRHLVMLEVFDENGQRLRPQGTPATGLSGAETTAAFTYRRRYQDTGATANVPFGALTHMFWWDNRDVFADIVDLRRNGLIFNAECLFFGGDGDTTFSVGYRAYHPREQFQLYHNITWKRGLGSTAFSSGVLQPVISNNVGKPPALPGGSATNTFDDMLRPDLDPNRRKCAFTAFLNIWNKRTDGDDLGFQYRGDTAAFVLEIES
ncbi:hypothetical protein [Primorskyibacter sp. 2E233]|uniref:hypothetical protein n=1 Tax=Primorskyibacter sp. 2E233 TaxID=3413431 RepID=UPI003BF371DA